MAESIREMLVKIAFFSTQSFEPLYFNAISHDHHIHFFKESLSERTAILTKGFDAVCVFVNDQLNKACIQQLHAYNIRFIALRCAGFNQVDLVACKEYHIPVVRVPRYSPHAVAEYATALLLCLNRKIHKAYHRVREGNFDLNGLQGFDLYQKTVGIIGLGAIGSLFAKICLGFGCQVIGFDPYVQALPNVEMVSFNTLLSQADVISLHCPLNAETYHLIDEKQIALMKPKVVLINTGRGALIQTKALIKALKSGKIAGVGLDVYEQETGIFFADHSLDIIQDDVLMRLLSFPNVIVTSHQGFLTDEALHEIARVTIENLNDLVEGRICPNQL
jgi:D-lactate dehydrogenase